MILRKKRLERILPIESFTKPTIWPGRQRRVTNLLAKGPADDQPRNISRKLSWWAQCNVGWITGRSKISLELVSLRQTKSLMLSSYPPTTTPKKCKSSSSQNSLPKRSQRRVVTSSKPPRSSSSNKLRGPQKSSRRRLKASERLTRKPNRSSINQARTRLTRAYTCLRSRALETCPNSSRKPLRTESWTLWPMKSSQLSRQYLQTAAQLKRLPRTINSTRRSRSCHPRADRAGPTLSSPKIKSFLAKIWFFRTIASLTKWKSVGTSLGPKL